MRYFSDCILNGRDPEPDAEEGLADLRVIDGIWRAIESRRPEPLAPFERSRRIDTAAQKQTLSTVSKPEPVNATNPSENDDRPAPAGCRQRKAPWDVGGGAASAVTTSTLRETTMKNALIALALVVGAAGAYAQATTAVKKAGTATAETAKEATENVKAAASSEPAKTVHKVKAKVHKAKAHMAGTEAKDAAKNIGK